MQHQEVNHSPSEVKHLRFDHDDITTDQQKEMHSQNIKTGLQFISQSGF